MSAPVSRAVDAIRRGGIVVYLRGQEGRGVGLPAMLAAYRLQDVAQRDTAQAPQNVHYLRTKRDVLGHDLPDDIPSAPVG